MHVRPGEPGWASPAQWAALSESVGGRLVRVQSPFLVCEPDVGSPACVELGENLTDPFYIDQKRQPDPDPRLDWCRHQLRPN
jgi:hypothetical protein